MKSAHFKESMQQNTSMSCVCNWRCKMYSRLNVRVGRLCTDASALTVWCSKSIIFTSPARVVAKYCDEYVCVCLCVCVSVCLSVCPWGYLPNHMRNLNQIFCACCLWLWLALTFPPAGWRNPKGRGSFGAFRPLDSASCSMEFGSHTKTADRSRCRLVLSLRWAIGTLC